MPSPWRCRTRSLLIALALLSPELWGADDWVLAASRFSSDGLPAAYESYAESLPLMVSQSLEGGFMRFTAQEETLARERATRNDKLLSLVKDRASLISQRDKILFDPLPSLTRSRRRAAAEKKIREKEKEIRSFQESSGIRQKAVASGGSPQRVALWEGGSKLYDGGAKPLSALRQAGISGLITGTIEDTSGYLVVTMKIETGIEGIAPSEYVAAAPWEELGRLVDNLTAAVKTTLSHVEAVTLQLEIFPEGAEVFVDGKTIPSGTRTWVVPAGTHRIDADAAGHVSSFMEANFEAGHPYRVAINLEPETRVAAGFSASVPGSLVYLDSLYVGESPVTLSLPLGTSLGSVTDGGVTTWFYVQGGPGPFEVKSNRIKTEKRIEGQRSVLYWSLGALYISLPVSMLAYGTLQDKLRAYDAGKLPDRQTTYDDINRWGIASNAASAASVILGVNYVIQLVRYLLAAEQALPQEAGLATD